MVSQKHPNVCLSTAPASAGVRFPVNVQCCVLALGLDCCPRISFSKYHFFRKHFFLKNTGFNISSYSAIEKRSSYSSQKVWLFNTPKQLLYFIHSNKTTDLAARSPGQRKKWGWNPFRQHSRVEIQMEISMKTEIKEINPMKRQNTKSLAGCKAKYIPRLSTPRNDKKIWGP